MKYFAHGHRFVGDPYFLAGTAVPDWLSVVDRKVRVRAAHAWPFVNNADSRISALAQGILQHHQDDDWFHKTAAFAHLSLALSQQVRLLLPDDDGLRCQFLGHILVEILLDAELIAERPDRLEAYYRALQAVEPHIVAGAVSRMAARRARGLTDLIPRFAAERFLSDYGNNAKLFCNSPEPDMETIG